MCVECAAPLTAYAGQTTGEISLERAAQIQKLRMRPPGVLALVCFDLLVLVLGPVATLLRSIRAQPALNPDQTNYIGHAFGAVSTALWALVLAPVALALAVAALWAWTQRSGGWWATMVAAAAVAGAALLGLGISGFMRIGAFAASILVLALGWNGRMRSWYGIE